ncbi:SRPBCC family protein [Amycolatopsis sp. CA-126428]|uniref:SRPBCC family protein n=1 Tax=Amycolatopsis sp. CA-126428 TaxID=2073158 RepID=UPI001304D97A|nr:SRPBCC family protein [Amycolatopsis sp. CA-126428]
MYARNEGIVTASPERVWQALTDAEAWPRWYRNARRVHIARTGPGPTTLVGPVLLDAFLRTGTSYLDFAGETPFFEHALSRADEIRGAGIVALPGAGARFAAPERRLR